MGPTFLDRAIASVAPTWGARRAEARARMDVLAGASKLTQHRLELLARRYEGADRGRRTQGWVSPDTSPISATRGALHQLRARCRDLRRNNPWAKTAIENLVSDIVGDGIRVKFSAESDELEQRVKQRWADWTESTACDAGGRYTFAAMQAALCESMIEGGQALMRRRFRLASDGLPVPVQLQALEGDHIDTFRDEEQDANGNRIAQGKAYDALGRWTGTYLFRSHPGDLFFGTLGSTSVFVPASELSDLYRCDRLGQVRGIPWGAPVILRLHDLDAYEDNEALRLVVATAFSAFVHDLSPDVSMTSGVGALGQAAITNDKGQPADELEPGTIEYLPPGKDITFPTVPNNEGYEKFTRGQLRAIAKGFGTTYEGLTGDFSGFTFSSARMAYLIAHRNYSRTRLHLIIPHLCEPARREFLRAMVIQGDLTQDELLELSHTWISPRREMIDPRTEVEAAVSEVRAGFKSLTQVVEGLGLDSEAVLEQLAKDLEGARAKGLQLSTDGTVPDPGKIQSVNATNGADDRRLTLLERAVRLDGELLEARANGASLAGMR